MHKIRISDKIFSDVIRLRIVAFGDRGRFSDLLKNKAANENKTIDKLLSDPEVFTLFSNWVIDGNDDHAEHFIESDENGLIYACRVIESGPWSFDKYLKQGFDRSKFIEIGKFVAKAGRYNILKLEKLVYELLCEYRSRGKEKCIVLAIDDWYKIGRLWKKKWDFKWDTISTNVSTFVHPSDLLSFDINDFLSKYEKYIANKTKQIQSPIIIV
jgi:hypothetical protein